MVTESVAMAVFREAMGLLSLAGLPVPSLGFPVNAKSPLAAALLRTVGLAPPAPAADKEPPAAEATMNLDKKQGGLQPCKQSEAVIEIRRVWGFRSFSELFFKARSCYFGLFLFFILSFVRGINKKALLGEGPGVVKKASGSIGGSIS